MCELPECRRTKYIDENGKVFDFCGKRHADEAKKNNKGDTDSHHSLRMFCPIWLSIIIPSYNTYAATKKQKY